MKVVAFYLSLLLLPLSLLLSAKVQGQEGLHFLSHYKVATQLGNQMWGIVEGENQEMFFLNRKGVFSFDGYGWEALPIKERPFALCSHGQLYVSTENGVFSFKRAAKGQFISNPVEGGVNDYFHKFVKEGNNLYAIGTQNVVQVMPGEPEILKPLYTEIDSSRFVTEAFTLNGKLFIVQNKSQVFLVRSGHAIPLSLGLPYLVDINFVFGDDNVVFVGLSNNHLFRFDGKKVVPVSLKDQSYFDGSYLNGGIMIDPTHMALSTMLGGCVVIDIRTGESTAMINYSAGLPDDEISALGVDAQKGLWLAHGMGVSRVDFQIPLRTFTHFSGLSGNLLSVAELDSLFYVGTSEGLFILDVQRDYTESVVSVRQKVSVPKLSPKQAKSKAPAPVEIVDTRENKKKGFFGRMFTSSSERPAVAKDEAVIVTQAKPAFESAIRVLKKKLLTLQSVSYVYRKVSGVEGKCQQLVLFDGRLFAITSRGVFVVEGKNAMPVVVGKNIRFATHSISNKRILWLGSEKGIASLTSIGNDWQYKEVFTLENDEPTSLVELSEKELLVSTESKVLRVLIGGKNSPMGITLGGIQFDSPLVRRIAGKVRVISSNKVYAYSADKNSVVRDSLEFPDPISNLILTQNQTAWLCFDRTWKCYSEKGLVGNSNAPFVSLFDKVNAIFVTPTNELLIVNSFKEVARIAVPKGFENLATIPLVVKRVEDREGQLLDIEAIELTYANNSLKIQLASPAYLKEQSTEYHYIVDGMMTKWTAWTSNPELNFPFFPSGRYTLKVQSRDLLGRQSKVYSLDFRIKPPFWRSVWFISICVFVILMLIVFLIRVRERRLLHDKIVLEQKVRMRTQTIEEQKEELESQRDALAKQNDEIEAQRDHIAMQSENITKSIEYAKKIQTAAMPSHEAVNAILPEHFILFKPRDIVSGDFYWTTSYHGKVIIAAADCTGHGVPGAFMSMLGLSFLNEVVVKVSDLHPDTILNKLRSFIKSTLSQKGAEGGSKDGMDIAICIIDTENRKMEFAGAYNPLYYIMKGELLEIKGDKMPVGIHVSEKDSFTNHSLSLDGISAFYLFSDGFVDQFGGEKGRKFKSKKFKALLDEIQAKPMAEQGEILDNVFETWKGANEQVDDVLVMGVRLE